MVYTLKTKTAMKLAEDLRHRSTPTWRHRLTDEEAKVLLSSSVIPKPSTGFLRDCSGTVQSWCMKMVLFKEVNKEKYIYTKTTVKLNQVR